MCKKLVGCISYQYEIYSGSRIHLSLTRGISWARMTIYGRIKSGLWWKRSIQHAPKYWAHHRGRSSGQKPACWPTSVMKIFIPPDYCFFRWNRTANCFVQNEEFKTHCAGIRPPRVRPEYSAYSPGLRIIVLFNISVNSVVFRIDVFLVSGRLLNPVGLLNAMYKAIHYLHIMSEKSHVDCITIANH